MKSVVYACDVGSTIQGRFAWKRSGLSVEKRHCEQSSIQSLVECLKRDLEEGYSIALRFESPLFIPVPALASHLSMSREGDSNRSWSAPAGAAVATLGLHQAAWILKEIRVERVRFTVAAIDWPPTGNEQVLFCWEAFVSGSEKASCELHPNDPDKHCDKCLLLHEGDAAIAAAAFQAAFEGDKRATAVKADSSISLIGAAALWSGWATNVQILREQPFVVKPTTTQRS